MGEMKNVYSILVGKPEGKGKFGRHRHGWYDNIRIDLKETACEGADWIYLVQDRDQWRAVVNTVMKILVP
jgi:hypothetical protein